MEQAQLCYNRIMIDIYLVTSLLFCTLFVSHGRNPLKDGAFFSMLFLLIATALRVEYSDFSIIKLAFILYGISLPMEYIKEKNHEQIVVSTHILSIMTAFIVLFQKLISSKFFSVILILLFVLSFAIDVARKERERTQSDVILICGATVTLVSASYYNQYFGLFIMCIHLMLKLALMKKNHKQEAKAMKDRLHQLEYSFNKQVEHETRKISRGMENKVEEIEEKSMRDPLTKVLNRAMIEKKVQNIIDETQSKLFSIALIDLDNFKAINDTFGHVTGDKCLLNLTEFFMKNKRRADIVGRFGGDEFIIVMPNLNAEDAVKVLEFHRKAVEEKSNPHFTITAGISTYPYDGNTLDELISSADLSLYRAKKEGKNKVNYSGNYR